MRARISGGRSRRLGECRVLAVLLAPPTIIAPVYIDPSAEVDPSAKIGPNVSLGPHVRIGAGVRIKDAILLEGVVVDVSKKQGTLMVATKESVVD